MTLAIERRCIGTVAQRPATATDWPLMLRPPRLGDAEAIAHHLGDYEVAGMLQRVPRPYDRRDALEWLGRRDAGKADEGLTLALDLPGAGLVGIVSLEEEAGGLPRLGYWLARPYWRRGLMGEATSTVLARLVAARPGVRVASSVFADNPASLHLQSRLGFRVVGCRQVFSMARNRTVTAIETVLDAVDFTPLRRRPAGPTSGA